VRKVDSSADLLPLARLPPDARFMRSLLRNRYAELARGTLLTMSVEPMNDLPEHVRRNRDHWDQLARTYVAAGERAWASDAPSWGIWSVPESEVDVS
jgi:hypothetical protein